MSADELDARARRRFSRQTRLAEIGVRGQLELCRATASPGATDPVARDAEARYLAASGVTVGGPSAAPVGEDVARVLAALDLRSDEAQSFAEGALRALATMRRVLGVR